LLAGPDEYSDVTMSYKPATMLSNCNFCGRRNAKSDQP
jgi:hypothetical protein